MPGPLKRGPVLLLLGILLGSASGPAAAQEEIRISPDRPTVSNNADIVPPGGFQIEAGLVYAQERFAARPTEHRGSVEGTLRVGVLRSLEVRLFGEPFVGRQGEDSAFGNGDFGLGMKYRLLDAPAGAWLPAVAIQPLVLFPVARAPSVAMGSASV
jgi:hypothetical protein